MGSVPETRPQERFIRYTLGTVQEVIERYAPRFAVLSGVSLFIVLIAWLGMGLRMLERIQHPNRLSQCNEAYLRSCQHQLVDWREWRTEALEEAQKLDRLVFVELGAYWSGRAKRLGKELFQDSGVADLLNREFVPIKVDADSAPKRARYLHQVAELFNLPPRYPLILLFTPDGKPLLALTPETRAELMRVLEEASKNYRVDPEKVHQQAEQWMRLWEQSWLRPASPVDYQTLSTPFMPKVEDLQNALGSAQRTFLNQLEWLLSIAEENPTARALLLDTLRALRNSPLWDAEGRGFFALVEGEDYEGKPMGGKRLGEHARLLHLYTRASRYDPNLATTAHELAECLRKIFWSERPAGFYNCTSPPQIVRSLAREPQALTADRTFVAENNALAVIALVEYARRFPDAPQSEWARYAVRRTMDTLRAMRSFEGYLYHTSHRQTAGWLRDIALTLQAGCLFEQLSPDANRRAWLHALYRQLTHYTDPTGGYYDTPHSQQWGEWNLAPIRSSWDEELPADNVLVARALYEYSRLINDSKIAQQAEQTLRIVAGDIDPQQPEQGLSLFATLNVIRHGQAHSRTH